MAVGRKGKCVNGLSTGQSMASPPYIPNQGPRDRSSTSHPHSSSSRRKSLRLPITVKGNTFIQSDCLPAIREIIEATFDAHPDSCWPYWTAIPIQTRGMMFDEFAAACILTSFFGRVRISRSQPEWIGNTHWEHLCAEWDTEEYKKRSRINKANRQKRKKKTLSSREKDSALVVELENLNIQGESNQVLGKIQNELKARTAELHAVEQSKLEVVNEKTSLERKNIEQSLRISELEKKLEAAILNLATKDRELQQIREENRQTAAVFKKAKEKHEEELQQLRDENRQTAAILKEVKEKHEEAGAILKKVK